MKIIHTKAIAVLGMILSLVTLCFLVRGLVYTIARDARYEEGAAFFAGISAILASSCSMLFYGVDGILCVVKAFKRIRPRINIVLAVMSFVGIAFGVLLLVTPLKSVVSVDAWYVFYFILFVLEVIALVMHLKDKINTI